MPKPRTPFRKAVRRVRRCALAIGLIVYAHALLAGAVALVVLGESELARGAGVALLSAIVVLISLVAGVVMGNRLHQDIPPVPTVAEVDRELSGAGDDAADDWMEQMGQYAEEPHSAFNLTAKETRR